MRYLILIFALLSCAKEPISDCNGSGTMVITNESGVNKKLNITGVEYKFEQGDVITLIKPSMNYEIQAYYVYGLKNEKRVTTKNIYLPECETVNVIF